MKYDSLKEVLESVNGSTFAGIDTVTQVKLKGGKKNPLQGKVSKITKGSTVMLFTNKKSNGYVNMIKRRLEKEGKDPESFILSPRVWGERVANTPFVEHNGKVYMECIFLKTGKTSYIVDGEEVEKENIEGLPEVNQNDDSQGGVENKVIIRTYAIESIEKLRVMGEEIG